nr:LPS export ABC transporter periplasmic protein LptC [Armatimonas sp.]
MRYTAPLLCLLFWGCGPRQSPTVISTPRPQPSSTPFPVSGELSGAKTVLSDGKGNRLLELTGLRAALAPGATEATLEGTRAVLYKVGKPVLTIIAKNVRVEANSHKLTAEGSVSAQTTDGRTVRCDTLIWRPETNQVDGKGKVAFLAGSNFALYGSRFTADTLLQTLKILP